VLPIAHLFFSEFLSPFGWCSLLNYLLLLNLCINIFRLFFTVFLVYNKPVILIILSILFNSTQNLI